MLPHLALDAVRPPTDEHMSSLTSFQKYLARRFCVNRQSIFKGRLMSKRLAMLILNPAPELEMLTSPPFPAHQDLIWGLAQ